MFDDHDDKGNTGGVLGIGAVKILALPKGGGVKILTTSIPEPPPSQSTLFSQCRKKFLSQHLTTIAPKGQERTKLTRILAAVGKF